MVMVDGLPSIKRWAKLAAPFVLDMGTMVPHDRDEAIGPYDVEPTGQTIMVPEHNAMFEMRKAHHEARLRKVGDVRRSA